MTASGPSTGRSRATTRSTPCPPLLRVGTARALRHPLVRRDREEVGELVGQRHLGEQRRRVVPPPRAERLVAHLLADRRELLVDQPLDELAGDRRAARELHVV